MQLILKLIENLIFSNFELNLFYLLPLSKDNGGKIFSNNLSD